MMKIVKRITKSKKSNLILLNRGAALQLTSYLKEDGFSLVALNPYISSTGKILFYRLRLENSGGAKRILPMSHQNGEWVLKEPECPVSGKPLYRIPRLVKNPDATVYVVEGENKANALNDLGLVATTSGSATSASGADWTPMRGRKVVIWPDNDNAGKGYAAEVTQQLEQLGCDVEWIDVGRLRLPEKGDVVNYIERNPDVSRREIRKLARIAPQPSTDYQPAELGKAILDFNQLLEIELPKREMILPWLQEGGLGMVMAKRGVGKTFFGESLACAVANGDKFMKWDVQKPCGVLYIDGEMSLIEFRDRLKSFRSIGTTKYPLLTLSHEIYWKYCQGEIDIANAGFQAELMKYIDGNPEIKLLIVDNLSCLAKIRENESDDWRNHVLPFLVQCRRRGVAVLLIHHANKKGEQRGTGAREDQLDISIKLVLADNEYKEGAFFSVEFTKNRGVFGDLIEPFTAKLVKTKNGLLEWKIGTVQQNVEQRLVRLLEGCGEDGITVTDAADELSVSKPAVSKAKGKLERSGKIKPSNKRTDPMVIADKSQKPIKKRTKIVKKRVIGS